MSVLEDAEIDGSLDAENALDKVDDPAIMANKRLGRPYCPTSCGNVSIPFPFGIGDGCYLDDWYEVTCNSSGPFLKSINLEVLDISISLEANTMLVNHPVFQYCNLEVALTDL
ncbi:hypothetical protein LWI29_022208 [Acer saccharum]|uniref:Wall-associated receptor kinase galacturonan-binding domain-containing protein n=1 Tax=Acer saccharum TaxID=4024 RepID=A0AA39SJP9_ACESA|nr:hypothetical protein LWI29_022208 [Acer saccharum]